MTISGAHTVGAPDGGPGLPGTGWSREHGDLRVAHFLGLHALQAIPLFALAVGRRGSPRARRRGTRVGVACDGVAGERRRIRIVWAISASYASLFALLLWQALRGQSVAAPDTAMVTALGVWAVLTALGVWIAGSRRESAPAHAVVY
jgi:hypothetical protein